ncbi:hypothetical protein F3Y22_tig00110610pilonHSYRG00677 [Hibiscus syriacus]|uniref:RNase H type-1 domain-containing protein n=1 Tax=Hibiscus syriacus TaxID=106335 RepID=A0A6A3A0Z7_HIBSY|nr:hypothetical protein F3Y22_tig00110610pilonHSYRG00677 [Hibiscus syriacus]
MSGFVKLNTDGACQGNPGVAGAGELFRSETGACIQGFATHLGVCSSVAAKLYAIRFGLSLAWKFGFNCIVCEIDAKVVLQLIEEDEEFMLYDSPPAEIISPKRTIEELLSPEGLD